MSIHEIVDCMLVYDWIAGWTFDEKNKEKRNEKRKMFGVRAAGWIHEKEHAVVERVTYVCTTRWSTVLGVRVYLAALGRRSDLYCRRVYLAALGRGQYCRRVYPEAIGPGFALD